MRNIINRHLLGASFLTRVLRAMMLVSDSIQKPKSYRVDIATDIQVLAGEFAEVSSSSRFVWIVRDMGTNIFPLSEINKDRNLTVFNVLVKEKETEYDLFYWNGENMLALDGPHEARNLINMETK